MVAQQCPWSMTPCSPRSIISPDTLADPDVISVTLSVSIFIFLLTSSFSQAKNRIKNPVKRISDKNRRESLIFMLMEYDNLLLLTFVISG